MKTHQLTYAAPLIALAMAGCRVDRAAQQQAKRTEALVSQTTIPVTVQPVATQTISQTLEVTGDLTTSQDSEVGAKLSGKLVAVNVKDGDSVVAGQIIAQQDTASLQAQFRQALASVQSARSGLAQAIANAAIGPSKSSAAVSTAQAQVRSAYAQLAKAKLGARPEEKAQADASLRAAKSNMDTAKRELDRTKTLVQEGVFPQQRLDTAQSAYDGAKSQFESATEQLKVQQNLTRPEDLQVAREALRQAQEALISARAQKKLDVLLDQQVQTAQANVQSAQAQVDVAKQAINDATIRAPFTGKIAGRPSQAGSIVGPGAAIARVIGAGGLYFEGQVPESAISDITPGRPVAVTIESLGNRRLQGLVAAVSPQGQDIGRIFKVRIQLTGDFAGVRPGMFVRGQINVKTVVNASVAPFTAIVTRNGKEYVFLAENNKAKQVPVIPGIKQGDVVEVRGVNPGDPLIVKGQTSLEDGSTLQVTRADANKTASAVGG